MSPFSQDRLAEIQQELFATAAIIRVLHASGVRLAMQNNSITAAEAQAMNFVAIQQAQAKRLTLFAEIEAINHYLKAPPQ